VIEQSFEEGRRLKPIQRQALKRLGLTSERDLFYYFPTRYETTAPVKSIAQTQADQMVSVVGQITKLKSRRAWRKKIPLTEAVVEDATGQLKVIWFHQAYWSKKIKEGDWVKLSGRISERVSERYLANPTISQASEATIFDEVRDDEQSTLTPIYPETRGLSSAWFQFTIKKMLLSGAHEKLIEPLPEAVKHRYQLPDLPKALIYIHQPRQLGDALAAKKRFSFEEIFLIQLSRLRDKQEYELKGGYRVEFAKQEIEEEFFSALSFTPTKAQKRAIEDIARDLRQNRPMMRLLEGDVGSGKTVVAAAAAWMTVRSGFQAAIMAPTEILAKQHFESLARNFPIRKIDGREVSIGLLTGGECQKFPSKLSPDSPTSVSRTQLLKWVASGEVPILVGTHTLIQSKVKFKNLALAVIDEQHRFGTRQRAALAQKPSQAPHLLSLTATPIPRTLALTLYGDLDLTLLDELPPGRKPIVTQIINEKKRQEAYGKIRQEVAAGRQAYIICPRIDAPDPTKALALNARSAKEEALRLQADVFPNFNIGLIHGKLKPREKDAVMTDFARGEVDVLVATSVVEVGVNVPNATVILIEGADRFGLAQLHQLRGRVLRSTDQAYCFLQTDNESTKTKERLGAITNAKNGFELAELDLKLRGAGSLGGSKQWGLSDVGMEALQNLKMVEAARKEAKTLLAEDPTLTRNKILKDRLDLSKTKTIHFE